MANTDLDADIKFALVIAERAKYEQGNGNAHIGRWQNFLKNVQDNLAPPEGTTTIHENVWLIPVDGGLIFLGSLLRMAESGAIPTRVLFLAESPVWIQY